jgi:hypothetical protein
MENAIRTFQGRLTKDTVGLFFYAGHGMQVAGTNYLVPIGAKIAQERADAICAGPQVRGNAFRRHVRRRWARHPRNDRPADDWECQHDYADRGDPYRCDGAKRSPRKRRDRSECSDRATAFEEHE